MERLAYSALLKWKRDRTRKPILLEGARQTGKTYLIEELFGPREFRLVHKLDFLENPQLSRVFDGSLSPDQVISNIELALGIDIDEQNDLIFFDEVGECQAALDSLKYFAENRPEAFVCASGSNIGLMSSFPVGKVEILEIFPFCFEEFLMANGNDRLLHAFRDRYRNSVVHELIWNCLCDYYYVGGLPEAVAAWYDNHEGMNARLTLVDSIHRNLLHGFVHDFGKYSGSENGLHIESVFRNVSGQLARSIDVSVQKFSFANVIEKKRRYRDLRGPIDWLQKSRLVWKCSLITSKPVAPLSVLAQESRFRLYLFDIGILGKLVGLTYADHKHQDLTFKGFFAENFVATEYRSRVGYPIFGWQEATAEIEFLHRSHSGSICPVEVKSGKRTKAKSLRAYIDRYGPEHAIKLANVPRLVRSEDIVTCPLYDAQFLVDL